MEVELRRAAKIVREIAAVVDWPEDIESNQIDMSSNTDGPKRVQRLRMALMHSLDLITKIQTTQCNDDEIERFQRTIEANAKAIFVALTGKLIVDLSKVS